MAIQTAGQIVFHSPGDTGSVIGPITQSLVADKMVTDFTEANSADVPSFCYHLGDAVYYFGEGEYYYDQFIEPFRNYPAPILGIPGNHDGVVYPTDPATTLQAYLRNFCASAPAPSPDAGGLSRTTMIQPGVYYTFDAPFVRILGVYGLRRPFAPQLDAIDSPNALQDRQHTHARKLRRYRLRISARYCERIHNDHRVPSATRRRHDQNTRRCRDRQPGGPHHQLKLYRKRESFGECTPGNRGGAKPG